MKLKGHPKARPSQCVVCGCFLFCLHPDDPECAEKEKEND